MSKKIIITFSFVAIVSLVIAFVYFFLIKPEDSQNSEVSRVNESVNLRDQLNRACEVYDQAKAEQLLGPNASRDERIDENASSSDNIAVSKCLYTEGKQDFSLEDQVSSEITIRSARNQQGAEDNKMVFDEASKQQTSQGIEGYGEKAFWNVEFAQLNIINDGDWYILEHGKRLPEARTLDESQEMANILQLKN